ncbi:alpha/beta hydrolase [Mucilaginibacter aquariorum]|uniref:Alpha/beta hydrolase n=1 Tax=Mucilaginibacter aquariorum TaxID=2967225 RepID=A0ABT1SXD2_9SPHI|nr:alpha/beta hydrolase [Mucilaginibacter aquariorum]MCQ6957010.1 alpha/beta hydrolase [Mucilaginibacter aquariorum]
METPTNVEKAIIPPFAKDPMLSVEVRDFLKELNAPGAVPLESLPPLDARKVLEGAQSSVEVDMSGIDESEHSISADGFNIVLNIVRPEGSTEVLPVFIFIHGGGWILGDYPTHKRMVRDLVVQSNTVGVFVNYTRTPDAAFPTAINEIFAATKWVAANGHEINVDGKRLAVVGNSVGGNMTAVTALKAKANHGPEIKLLIMMWPIVDANFETGSYKRFGEDRFLTTPLMKWMYDMYIPDPEKRKDIYASPLQATVEQLSGLPPTVIVVAENDVLRDEGEAFGRKLDEAEVHTTVARYNGVIHDFGLLNGLANIHPTKSLFVQAAAELKKHLK